MSKLISNPYECGYHQDDEDLCMHPIHDSPLSKCVGKTKLFPTACPLPDGITVAQCKETPTEMIERILKPKTT